MKNIQFAKIRKSTIGIYFNNLLNGYIKLNERDTNKLSILYSIPVIGYLRTGRI